MEVFEANPGADEVELTVEINADAQSDIIPSGSHLRNYSRNKTCDVLTDDENSEGAYEVSQMARSLKYPMTKEPIGRTTRNLLHKSV